MHNVHCSPQAVFWWGGLSILQTHHGLDWEGHFQWP